VCGTNKAATEIFADKTSNGPQALKRWFIFKYVTARVELVPFPFVSNSEVSLSLLGRVSCASQDFPGQRARHSALIDHSDSVY
jgi:hypothetical protein